jgi:hypothetical protein
MCVFIKDGDFTLSLFQRKVRTIIMANGSYRKVTLLILKSLLHLPLVVSGTPQVQRNVSSKGK